MNGSMTFGNFIRKKGREQNGTSCKTAEIVGIAPMYLCDIERDKKTNPSCEVMQKLIAALRLNEEETAFFYDLHAKANGIVSQDLTAYIMENDIIRTFLRMARDKSITESDWERVKEIITK